MGFFDYKEAKELYRDNKRMLKIINCLEDLDQYHLLRNMEGQGDYYKRIPAPVEEYKTWLTVCDGGLLFSTTLLSVEGSDLEMDLSFSTLQEWNTMQKHKTFRLPRGYFIIALLNYGDPICLSSSDSRVYHWDTEEKTFVTVWDSFADFLADECNTAVQMIEDDALDPIPMKMGVQDGQ